MLLPVNIGIPDSSAWCKHLGSWLIRHFHAAYSDAKRDHKDEEHFLEGVLAREVTVTAGCCNRPGSERVSFADRIIAGVGIGLAGIGDVRIDRNELAGHG